MIAVAVRMGDDQIDRRDAALRQPFRNDAVNGLADRQGRDGASRVGTRAGVEQDSSFITEEQVQERGFEAEALALAKDEGVVVEPMYL